MFEGVHELSVDFKQAKMWLSVKSLLILGSVCWISLSCPPPFFGPSCSVCHYPRCVFDYKENISYLHKDIQLFLENGKFVQGHNIFEVPQDNDSLRYSIYKPLPSNVTTLNEYMCIGINRKSQFCSKCKDGHAPSPYTYYGIPCTRCTPNSPGWIYYILLELGFPTIMFVIFLAFRVRLMSGYIVGFVFYCQAISYIFNMPFFFQLLMEKSHSLTITLLTVYGIWNMDFFRLIIPRFCVSEHLGTLDVVVLGYVSAFYPLVLTSLLYSLTKLYRNGSKVVVCMWQPFSRYVVRFRRHLRQDTSLVDVFATFYLLSYSKIIIVSLLLLQPQNYSMHSLDLVKRSVDPHIDYFHRKHLPYALPAIMILLTVGIIPVVVLCVYPSRYAEKIFSKCNFTASAGFARFVSAFQSSFKDGTNGTHDYRAVSSIYIFHRVLLYGSFVLLKKHAFIMNSPFILQAAIYITTFAFYLYARPYKSSIHNFIELGLLTLLTGQCVLNFQLYDGSCNINKGMEACSEHIHRNIIIQFCILCIPQCVFIIYVIWLLGKKVKIIMSPRQLQTQSFSLKNPTLHEYTSIG